MGIRTFTFDRELMREFIRFPYSAYRDDARWVPPLEAAIVAQLDASAEFMRCAGNAHRHFIAQLGSRTLGRVTASVNGQLRDETGAPLGCLGFFESEKDPAAAEDLINAARCWLRDQHQVNKIWGPMNFDVWHGYRFMTRGFGERSFLGEPYNKPYYPELFQRCGFTVRQRWHSLEVEGTSCERFRQRALQRRRELGAAGYRFVAFERHRAADDLRKLHALLVRSYAHFAAFTPISAQEFNRMALPLRYALIPGSLGFVHDDRNEPCGFATVLLDLSDALRAMKGRSTLLARARFFRTRRRTRRVFLHLVGLTPEEARRRSGLGAALVAHAIDCMRQQGQPSLIAALVAEGSPARGHLAQVGAVATREYALYELNA